MSALHAGRDEVEILSALGPRVEIAETTAGAVAESGAGIEPMGDAALVADWELVPRGDGVTEATLRLRNDGAGPVTITRMDALRGTLIGTGWQAHWFDGAWGSEFTPRDVELAGDLRIESRSGRSSNGTHPWLALEREGQALIVSPAWSGNWHISVERDELSAGISPWRFATDVPAGGSVAAPSVVMATGADVGEASARLAAAIGDVWIPRSEASESMRVEWNHWWPYEDAEVNEAVMAQNAAIATEIGIEQITLDAGWFGPAGDTFWENVRGDWDELNTERFPSGLMELGTRIREVGGASGIWIEAEAIGPFARLRTERPELVATSDAPDFPGYVCLGSAAGREFVADAMDAAVASIGAEWIKLDFNLDPGAGCTRTDHGHGAADGLYRHYLGLYEVLDAFRERHPEVILESCSSGGLRIDFGLARHVHCMFLSDPDYTEHHLQVLWGASRMLPPAAILHWSWSQWRGDYPASQLDFASLDVHDFDRMLRAAMLHRFGVSIRLPELRADLLERLRIHVALFNETLAPLVRSGVLVPLTGQPLRSGEGERVPAFRLSDDERHLVAVFQLEGGENPERIETGLDPDRAYRAVDLATDRPLDHSRGVLTLADDPQVTSWLVLITPDEHVTDESASNDGSNSEESRR